MDISTPLVKNIIVLDAEGKRVACKYYSLDEWPTLTSQMNFEKSLFAKTSRVNARSEPEIIMYEGQIVVFKFICDLHFYATGSEEENELILSTVLQAFFDATSLLLRGIVEKRTMLENLDLVLLSLDEILDGGVILETDPNVIANRVSMRSGDADIPFTEQTISQALATAREQITRSLLKG